MAKIANASKALVKDGDKWLTIYNDEDRWIPCSTSHNGQVSAIFCNPYQNRIKGVVETEYPMDSTTLQNGQLTVSYYANIYPPEGYSFDGNYNVYSAVNNGSIFSMCQKFGIMVLWNNVVNNLNNYTGYNDRLLAIDSYVKVYKN